MARRGARRGAHTGLTHVARRDEVRAPAKYLWHGAVRAPAQHLWRGEVRALAQHIWRGEVRAPAQHLWRGAVRAPSKHLWRGVVRAYVVWMDPSSQGGFPRGKMRTPIPLTLGSTLLFKVNHVL